MILTAYYLVNCCSLCVTRSNSSFLFSLTNHFISFLLVSLVVLVLFIFSPLYRTSFPPKSQNVSSRIHLTSKGLSLLFLETHQYFLFTDVAFFEDSAFFFSVSPCFGCISTSIISTYATIPLTLFGFIILVFVLLLLLFKLRS